MAALACCRRITVDSQHEVHEVWVAKPAAPYKRVFDCSFMDYTPHTQHSGRRHSTGLRSYSLA